MNKFNWIIAFFAIIALILGLKFWHHMPSADKSNGIQAEILSPPTDISKFSLLDAKGKPFTRNSFWAHWNFVVFGSASHSSTKTTETLGELDKAVELLKSKKQSPIPQVIFVSTDFANDTLDKLAKFTTGFDPDFIGVMGDPKQISLLTQIIPANQDPKSIILLVDPSGKLAAVFPEPHTPDSIVKDFLLILRNAG